MNTDTIISSELRRIYTQNRFLFVSVLILSVGIALALWGFGVPPVFWVIPFSFLLVYISKINWPQNALAILIVASFINIPTLYPLVFDLHLKPEHIAGTLAIGLIVFRKFATKRFFLVFKSGWFILGWIALTAVSAINSPDFGRSIVLTFMIFLACLPFFVLINAIQTRHSFLFAFKVLMVAGIIEAGFGVTTWLLGHFIDLWPLTTEELSGYIVTNGTWMETNIFGDFVVATTILLTFHFAEKKYINAKFIIIISICMMAIFISRTRGAWLAFIGCIILMPFLFPLTNSMKVTKFIKTLLFLFLFAIIGVILVAPMRESFILLIDRLVSFTKLTHDTTFNSRLDVFRASINSFLSKEVLLLGSGSNAFKLEGFNILGINNDWIGNIFLSALYDSGILGLISFFSAVTIPIVYGLKMARREDDPAIKARLLALSMACISIILTGQSNNHSWLALFWVYFGLLVAGVNISRENSKILKEEN